MRQVHQGVFPENWVELFREHGSVLRAYAERAECANFAEYRHTLHSAHSDWVQSSILECLLWGFSPYLWNILRYLNLPVMSFGVILITTEHFVSTFSYLGRTNNLRVLPDRGYQTSNYLRDE